MGFTIFVVLAVLVLFTLTALAASRARKRLPIFPAERPDAQAPTVTCRASRQAAAQRTPECERIRQQLRLPLMYDEGKIDALVAMEREHTPEATEEQLHTAAYERWVRDNR